MEQPAVVIHCTRVHLFLHVGAYVLVWLCVGADWQRSRLLLLLPQRHRGKQSRSVQNFEDFFPLLFVTAFYIVTIEF